MKASRFNVLLPPPPARGGAPVVYNTASARFAAFSAPEAAALMSGRTALLRPPSLERAARIGALLPDDHDELAWYGARHRKLSADRGAATYICALTLRCNLACAYCYQEPLAQRDLAFDQARAESLVRAIQARTRAEGTRRVGLWLFGGEPLLEPELCLFLLGRLSEWARAEGLAFAGTLTTNGVLLDDALLERLAPHLTRVNLTLDGPRELHDAVRRSNLVPKSFDLVLAAVRRLRARRIPLRLRVQASLANLERLSELADELRAQGLLGQPDVTLAVELLQDFNKWAPCDRRVQYLAPGSPAERALPRAARDLLAGGLPEVQVLPCVMARNVLCVDPHGDVFKCVTAIGRPERRVARLLPEGRFEFEPAFDDYTGRDPLSFAACRACAFLPVCGGGCPTSALARHGTYHRNECGNRRQVLRSKIAAAVFDHA